MTKKIDSIKHKEQKRAYIPSKEEAGFEDANPHVQAGKKTLELPVNPVVTRGQDPELFWMTNTGTTTAKSFCAFVFVRSIATNTLSPKR